MVRRWQSRSSNRGFTLLELVIAINLMVILVALVYNEIHTASRSWSAVAAETAASDDMRVAYRFIRQRLDQARPLTVEDDEGQRIAFLGEPQVVRFTAPAPLQQGNSQGLYLYVITFAKGDGQGQLQVSYSPYYPGMRGFPETHPDSISVLLGGGVDGGIDYFGVEGASPDKGWHDSWERRDELPELVRFRMGKGGQGMTWPVLVVQLKSRQASVAPR